MPGGGAQLGRPREPAYVGGPQQRFGGRGGYEGYADGGYANGGYADNGGYDQGGYGGGGGYVEPYPYRNGGGGGGRAAAYAQDEGVDFPMEEDVPQGKVMSDAQRRLYRQGRHVPF